MTGKLTSAIWSQFVSRAEHESAETTWISAILKEGKLFKTRRIIVVTTLLIMGGFTNLGFGQNDLSANTESWYTYWGVGSAEFTYPSEVADLLDMLEQIDGVTRTRLALDMFGFYWHVNPMTIGGFVINGAADAFDIDGETMQWNHYLYSGSMIHYLGSTFGKGPFMRVDAGLAKMVLQSSQDDPVTSENGYGGLIGGGWSFDLGGTRLLLNVNYAYRYIESEATEIIGFSVGGLF